MAAKATRVTGVKVEPGPLTTRLERDTESQTKALVPEVELVTSPGALLRYATYRPSGLMVGLDEAADPAAVP